MNRSRAWAGGCVACQIRVEADPAMGEESAGGAAHPSVEMISSVLGGAAAFLGRQNAVSRAFAASPAAASTESASAATTLGRQTTPRGTGDHAKLLAAAPSASDVEVAVPPGREEIVPDLAQADPTPDQAPGRAQVMPCQIRVLPRKTPVQLQAHGRGPGGEAPAAAQWGERCGTPRQGPGAGRGCIEGSPRQIKRVEVRGGPPRHVKAKGEAEEAEEAGCLVGGLGLVWASGRMLLEDHGAACCYGAARWVPRLLAAEQDS